MQHFARAGRHSLSQSALIGDTADYLARRGGDLVSEVGYGLAIGVQQRELFVETQVDRRNGADRCATAALANDDGAGTADDNVAVAAQAALRGGVFTIDENGRGNVAADELPQEAGSPRRAAGKPSKNTSGEPATIFCAAWAGHVVASVARAAGFPLIVMSFSCQAAGIH